MTEEAPPPVEIDLPPVEKGRPKHRRRVHRFIIAMVALVALVAAVGVGLRYYVTTGPGRQLIVARTTGLKLGPVGRLKIEGLTGDVFSDFSVARLIIYDEKGVWLEGRKVHVQWNYRKLFQREFSARLVAVDDLKVYRRPILTPKEKDRGLPVSFRIDRITARLETLPAATVVHGVFNVTGNLTVARRGGGAGHVEAASLLHRGDGLKADFSYGAGRTLLVAGDVVEAEGGAIAGALGLPASKPFLLHARIGGVTDDGQIDVLATVGKDRSLEARGGWNKNGLRADGRIDLTASTWTTGQVARFGPELKFSASAAEAARKDTYATRLHAESDNLDLTATGPVNTRDRSTPGLQLDFKVDDMSRLQKVLDLGPSEFHGKAVGKFNAFTVTGRVQGDRAALWDYSLSRLAGTAEVSLARREVTIKADLTGAGGGGTGMFSGLMGATPHVVTEMVRLADKRLLIRSIDAQAAGFELHGEGDRTPVIGTLNFDGQARITNLDPIHKGASGTVEGEWTASTGMVRGWAFTAKVQAAQLATGLAQADRLLGPSPRLDARAEFDQGVWKITRSTLNGKMGDARATGAYGPQNALNLNGDWEAKGPFQAGPVEIAGNLSGTHVIRGTLDRPRADLTARIPGIDVGALALTDARLTANFALGDNDSSGTIALTAQSPQGPASARAAYRFPDNGVDLTAIDAAAGGVTAKGSLSLRNNQPSRADLALTAVKGAFLSAGQAQGTVRIVDAPGGAQADVNLRVSDLQFPNNEALTIKAGTLTGSGPLARMPYTLRAEAQQGEIPIVLNGTGIASQKDPAWNVIFSGQSRVNKINVATVEPLTIEFGGPALTGAGTLSVGGGRAVLSGRQEGDNVTLSARLTNVDVSVLSQDLAGRIDAVLTASGRGNTLSGQLQADLQRLRSRDGPTDSAIDGTLKAALTGPRLAVDISATNQAGLHSTANAVLPAEASAAPFRIAVDRTKPIQGAFDIDGEVQPIWDLFFGGARSVGGRLQARGVLAGTLKDPQVTGQATLANGRFEDFASGLKLRQVTLTANLERNAITVRDFSGQDEGRGTLTGNGRMSLVSGGESSFTLQARQFLLIDNDLAQAQASGEVTVTRAADGKAALTGRLTIDRADVVADPPTPTGVVPLQVIEINVPSERADYFEAPKSRGPAVRLDVTLSAPRRVFVKGRGLDVELSLDAHVQGTSASPQLSGVAHVVRGEYQFAGKRFEFDESGVVYLASTPEGIRLDLAAKRADPSLTAIVQIKGTAAKPEITLTSTPALPNDEVLSQVLFGRSAAQLLPVEAAQLASSLAALAGGGGFDVIGGLREFIRLDRLAFGGGDSQSGLTVSGGKYVSDNVYLELTGGGRDGGAAQVEWRVRPNLSVVSRIAGTGDTRLSVRWRKDYGRKPAASTPPPAK